MKWNDYLSRGYKELNKSHLHFNVEGGNFEFDSNKDARQGAIILSRLYGLNNVIQSGFNVIVCKPNDDIDEVFICSKKASNESLKEEKHATLTEEPDKYGLPTDDELDLEKSNRIKNIEQDYANRKSSIANKRNQLQSEEEEFAKVCETFNNNNLSKLKNIYNDLKDGKLLDAYGWLRNDYYNKGTIKDDIIEYITYKDNCFEIGLYGDEHKYSRLKIDLSGNITPQKNKSDFKYWTKVINYINDNFNKLESSIRERASVENKKVYSKYASMFKDPSLLDGIKDVSNPGHWAHGCRYIIFSCGGKVYHYEDYDSGAYTNDHVHELICFNQIELGKDNYDESSPIVKNINPVAVGLKIVGKSGNSLYVDGKIDLNKLISMDESLEESIEGIDEDIEKYKLKYQNKSKEDLNKLFNKVKKEIDNLTSNINKADVLKAQKLNNKLKELNDELTAIEYLYQNKKQTNEDIEKHDELNPKLFDGEELKEEVKKALLKVVDAFVEDLKESDVDIKVKDAVIIGSNVNYNYTKDSDIDLHIIADSKDSKYPGELLTLLYSAYRSIFNKNYDITIKGIPCEVYVELDEVHGISNGIYSLYNGWLKEPEQKNVPELDEESFNKLFNEWEDKYFALLDEIGITPEEMLALKETKEDLEASEKVYDFIEDIYDLRKDSIANEGEFGLGNLVFKEFRNLGYLDALKHLTKILKGKELSLENMNEDLSQDTLENIYKYTLDNNGGTFDLRTGKSIAGDKKAMNIYSVEFKSHDWNKRISQVDKQEVLNTIDSLLRSELAKDADGLGTWSSAENERPQSSVGLNKFFKKREEAEKFALEHNQDAIGMFNSKGEYEDTIYKVDFKYKPKDKESKEEDK